MKDIDFTSISAKLRETRRQQQMTQEQLADQVGVNTSHISNIELNRVKVSLTCLVNMCNALHTTVDYVLENNYTDPDIQSSALDRAILRELKDCNDHTKETILNLIPVIRARETVPTEKET